MADSESEPTASVEVLRENSPLTSDPDPMTLFSLLTVTVPVGAAPFDTLAATVVVNVTDCPTTDGLSDETTLTAVPCAFSNTLTVLLTPLATARSGVPSPLKSPTAAEYASDPVPNNAGGPNVPSPLPSSRLTALPGDGVNGVLVSAMSRYPSPLKSAITIEEGFAPV